MSSRKLRSVQAFAATVAVGLSAWVPPASGGSLSPDEGNALYVPVQSISYQLGSKSVSGYFVEQAAQCLVTLMVIETSDPDAPLPLSPARVRLVLYPGQIAGLDSEEGRSLNFTCGEEATTLSVDAGARDTLMALQALALQKTIAETR